MVDSCLWIDFFNRGLRQHSLERISEQYTLCVNNAILAEVVPLLLHRREHRAAELLSSQEHVPMNINWPHINALQVQMLKAGVNKVGVLDLIILQNALQNGCAIASVDKHFRLLCAQVGLELVGLGEKEAK